MPSGTHGYAPDLATISSFFGAEKQSDGSWGFVHEKIPPNWTNRVSPYSGVDVNVQIVTMYLENPVLFGGNTAAGHFGMLPRSSCNMAPAYNGRHLELRCHQERYYLGGHHFGGDSLLAVPAGDSVGPVLAERCRDANR